MLDDFWAYWSGFCTLMATHGPRVAVFVVAKCSAATVRANLLAAGYSPAQVALLEAQGVVRLSRYREVE
jgi:hypothetical protein